MPEPCGPFLRPIAALVALWSLPTGVATALAAAEAPPPPAAVPASPALPAGRTTPAPAPAQPGVFGLTRLHRVDVTIPMTEWAVLQNESYARGESGLVDAQEDDITRADGRIVHIGGGFGGHFPWVHAELSIGGLVVRDTGLRFKGNGSYFAGAGMHRNLKVKTDFFGGKVDWDGIETINFNSGGRDATRMRESLAFAIFRAAGVPAPRTAYAEVRFTVPGLHHEALGGLFTVIENVNKQFLKHALPPGTGLLMKPERMQYGVPYHGENWNAYLSTYRPERDATPREQQRMIEFARLVNQPSVPEFRAKIGSYLDVDEFLRFLAVTALISHRDSFLGGNHNFFIYLDPRDDKIRFLPWDVDTAMSQAGGSLMAPWTRDNPLPYWLLDDPAVAARYRAIVREIVARVFNREELFKLIDALEPVVRPPLAREAAAMLSRGESNRPNGASDLRAFVLDRLTFVRAEMAGWPADAPEAPIGK